MGLALIWTLGLDLVFKLVDSRNLVRFNRENDDGFSSEEISENTRLVSLGVAGGDDGTVDGGDCSCFIRGLHAPSQECQLQLTV